MTVQRHKEKSRRDVEIGKTILYNTLADVVAGKFALHPRPGERQQEE